MGDKRKRMGKENILEQAEKLFTERGYEAVSIRTIAEACGVTNAALYYHFDDKSALFAEVMKQYTEKLHHKLHQAGEGQTDFQSKITAMAKEYVRLISNRRPLMFLIRHQVKELKQEGNRTQLYQMLNEVLKPLDDVFQEAIEDGAVREFPPGYSGAAALIGMIHSLSGYRRIRSGGMIEEDEIDLLVDFLWNGIKNPQ